MSTAFERDIDRASDLRDAMRHDPAAVTDEDLVWLIEHTGIYAGGCMDCGQDVHAIELARRHRVLLARLPAEGVIVTLGPAELREAAIAMHRDLCGEDDGCSLSEWTEALRSALAPVDVITDANGDELERGEPDAGDEATP